MFFSDSHSKSHLKTDAWYMKYKYKWQENSPNFDEYDNSLKATDQELFEDVELFQKCR